MAEGCEDRRMETPSDADDLSVDSPSDSAIFRLADRFVDEQAALDPIFATTAGVAGYDDRLPDYSPDGIEARAALEREALVQLALLAPEGRFDALAAAYLTERLDTTLSLVDTDEPLRDLNNLACPVQAIRDIFDLMSYESVSDWEIAARRMAGVPTALDGLRATYEEGRGRGIVAARRQAATAAEQTAVWSGERDQPAFFEALADRAAGTDGVSPSLLRELDQAAVAASSVYATFGVYLRDVYAPDAAEADAVGAERYRLLARSFLGAEIDLAEAYAWGWEELGRLESAMVTDCARIRPGASIAETVDWLDTESDLAVAGETELRDWLQNLMDDAIAALNGTHFDIAPPVRRVEAMIAPPGGAAAMYYTPPAEDFSRPGRTWYPSMGLDRYPLWGEVTTAYHEGVPGHHLQCAQVVLQRHQLSRYQRLGFISGHGEGWALYAERLMDELGFLERPEYHLGMLAGQALRAVRVIIDIGMHLGLEIPAGQPGPEPPFHPGERWTPELGQEFLFARARAPSRSWPARSSATWGGRARPSATRWGSGCWLEARAEAQARHGAGFDLKAFHAYALDLGPLGLDLLRTELARFDLWPCTHLHPWWMIGPWELASWLARSGGGAPRRPGRPLTRRHGPLPPAPRARRHRCRRRRPPRPTPSTTS